MTFPTQTQIQLDGLKSSGKTAVIVAVDRRAIGILGIADAMREDAPCNAARPGQNRCDKGGDAHRG